MLFLRVFCRVPGVCGGESWKLGVRWETFFRVLEGGLVDFWGRERVGEMGDEMDYVGSFDMRSLIAG
jgi:hypothetical protein